MSNRSVNSSIVAMILAGGKGTRLEALTKKNAKPAVFYGGKYRIIDFVLSNVANSGINTVGVCTQYESITLNTYIGNGSKWGIDGNRSLTTVLPPRQTESGVNWFKGTADAIYQNLDWLDSLNPSYVLILSGDHIYKADFTEMIDAHQKHNADVTIAAIDVDLNEAKRFGILNVDDKDNVIEFQEKPKHPKSTLASMGIYLFNYKLLRDSLKSDLRNENSSHDFGKDIIPSLIDMKKKVSIYRFKGYWKDVGTIQSLWEANMDLLSEETPIKIFDSSFKIFSHDTHSTPQYIGPNATIKSSVINQGASIDGKVIHSVIFNDVVVEDGAVVENSVIMPGTIVKKGVVLKNIMAASSLVIDKSTIGDEDHIILINK